MNNIVLTGRLTSDVELKTTPSGIFVCTFTLAVKRPLSSDVTDFIPCVAWRNTAEFISKYFAKGKMMAIRGALISRNYEDKNGNKRKAYEVLVENAEFCGDKGSSQPSEEKAPSDNNEEFAAVNDEDLPF